MIEKEILGKSLKTIENEPRKSAKLEKYNEGYGYYSMTLDNIQHSLRDLKVQKLTFKKTMTECDVLIGLRYTTPRA